MDYFEVNQSDEIRRLGIERPQGGTPTKVILITESGYLILVKSFTDDLSWQVQRQNQRREVSEMQEKRLKRWMKELLSSKGLNPENYHYIRHTSEELVIIHRYSTKPRVIRLEV